MHQTKVVSLLREKKTPEKLNKPTSVSLDDALNLHFLILADVADMS